MEPVAEVEVKVPGVMETLVAPEVVQLSVLLAPELMPVGLAANELIVGSEPFVEELFMEPQLTNATQAKRLNIERQIRSLIRAETADVNLLREQELLVSMNRPHGE